MSNLLDKTIRIILYSLVFLIPLFFLPITFEFLEFNKIYLLFFLTLISFILWLLKVILKRELKFKKVSFSFLFFLFLLFSILSAIFSVDKNFSLFGFYGRFSNGLIFLLLLVLFYFLIINNFSREQNSIIFNLFLISTFLVILFSYLSIFGIWQKYFNFPVLRSFNTTGSLESLAVFLAPIVILLTGLLLTQNLKIRKILYGILLFLSFSLLIIINFKPVWILLILSLLLFLIFAVLSKIFREDINKLLLPIFLIFLSIFFLIFNPFSLGLPREQILPQKISWQISLGATTENIKSGFLGSGLGTYFYDFSKFKPSQWNKNQLWLTRFDRAGSHLAEVLGVSGFLGFLSYLAFLASFFLLSFLFLFKKPEFFSIFLPFLTLFLGQIFYYQNAVLAFSFWFFLGLLVLNFEKIPEKIVSFKKIPEIGLVFNSFSLLILVFIFVIFYFGVKFYLADFYYLKALRSGNVSEQISFLERGVKLNQNSSQYKLDLARAYFLKASQELQKPNQEQDQNLILASIQNAINFLRGAKLENGTLIKGVVEISPNWVAGWENLGMIYREITPLSGVQALDWAIKSFEEAAKLEPQNPVLYTELGKLYLAQGNLEKAEGQFKIAIDAKDDYLDAQIQNALILEQKENIDEATKKFEELVAKFPLSIDARFHLGRLYYNKERLDEAILQFENAILIMPNHSNSLYLLGLCYEKKGDKEKALGYFEKVLELNPGNQDIIQKIEDLKK